MPAKSAIYRILGWWWGSQDEDSEDKPELDIDDVLMIEESQRASKLKVGH